MADFKVQTKKRTLTSDHEWSNDWYVSAANLGQAAATANLIHDFEVAVHLDLVFFTHDVVSPWPVSGGGFTTITRNDQGARSLGSSDYLTLFNTVRVDLGAGVGRPSPKYLRLPIIETETTAGALSSTLIALVESALDDLFDAVDALGTELEQSSLASIIEHSTYGFVQMRQLHRKRKRTVAP